MTTHVLRERGVVRNVRDLHFAVSRLKCILAAPPYPSAPEVACTYLRGIAELATLTANEIRARLRSGGGA